MEKEMCQANTLKLLFKKVREGVFSILLTNETSYNIDKVLQLDRSEEVRKILF